MAKIAFLKLFFFDEIFEKERERGKCIDIFRQIFFLKLTDLSIQAIPLQYKLGHDLPKLTFRGFKNNNKKNHPIVLRMKQPERILVDIIYNRHV